MLQTLSRAVLRRIRHEHQWETRLLGGGLRRQVCTRCDAVALNNVPRGGARGNEERAKRLWHLDD